MNAAAIFAKVVEARGFTAAARQLGLPKTTVSKRVGALEAELGARLLNRTTRQLSLTEAGARAYPHIVEALRIMGQAEREALAVQEHPAGRLTVAAPGGIGVLFLMPLITEFMALTPGVEITHLSTDEAVDLGEQRIDVMIWPGEPPPSAHAHSALIVQVELSLYASAAYLARNGWPQTPQDLEGHQVVAFTQAIGRRFAWQLSAHNSAVEIQPGAPIRFRSNDPGAVLAAIQGGFGIGALPTRFVDRLNEPSGVVRLLPEWQLPPIRLYALHRDGSAASLNARLFVAFVTDWFRRN